MAERSNIEWCDATFNPWIGCTKVSPACDHCYAERDFDIRRHVVQWGAGQARKRTGDDNWKKPGKWNAKPFFQCEVCGLRTDNPMRAQCKGPHRSQHIWKPARRRVFCASLADVFDNEVPVTWRQDLFDLIRRCENLDFLLLTKRVGNVTRMLQEVASMLRSEHGAQTEREPGLQAGPVDRTGDRRGGPNLARGEADFRSLDRRDEGDTVHASSGRAEDAGRLPAGAGDDRRKAALRGSGTAGVASLQGTDPAGPHGQSQGRREGLESPQGANLGGGRPIDASPARAGLAGEGHCGEIRDDAERGVARLSRQDLEARADLLAWIEQWLAGNPPRNVWLGATICNQDEADRDIPKLLATPAAVRFVSAEPLLGPVDLSRIQYEVIGPSGSVHYRRPLTDTKLLNEAKATPGYSAASLDWVVVGGESGPKARPMHPHWARDLRDQCAAAGVPFLFKQWGEWGTIPGNGAHYPAGIAPDGSWVGAEDRFTEDCALMYRIGKKAAGRLLDGVEYNRFPEVRP